MEKKYMEVIDDDIYLLMKQPAFVSKIHRKRKRPKFFITLGDFVYKV